jgi:gliding motility-associated-like protein
MTCIISTIHLSVYLHYLTTYMKKGLEFIVQTSKSVLKQCVVIFFLLCFFSFKTSALNYYWVGGTGNWSDLSHWATTSGGTTLHNQIPTAVDDVFFDGGSFSSAGEVVTLDAATTLCRDMVWTGVTNLPTLDGSQINVLKIYGSLTLVAGMNMLFNGEVNFEATALGKTIAMGGKSFQNNVYFNGVGGEWTLQDDFSTLNNFYFNNGTFNSNGKTLNTAIFYSVSGAARTLNMGSSIFNISTSGTYLYWLVDASLILNSGTSTINALSNLGVVYFHGGGHTYYDVNFINGNYGYYIAASLNGANTFHNVNFSIDGIMNDNNIYNNITFTAGHNYKLSSGTTQTVNGILDANGNCGALIEIKSNIQGGQASITHPVGNVNVSYVILKDIAAVGGANFTANNSINISNNSGWNFTSPTPHNLYWIGNTGNWDDGNHWSFTSGGTPSGCSPSPLDNVFFDANSFSLPNQIISINISSAYCRDMVWTGVTNLPTLDGSQINVLKIYGSLTLVAGMNMLFNGEVNFEATALGKTIAMGGKSFQNNVYFNGVGGEWTLQDDFSTLNNFYFNNGTFNSNGKTLNTAIFYSVSGAARTLNMGSSIFNISTSGTYLYWLVDASLILNSGTSTINALSNLGVVYFHGGGHTYYDVNFINGNYGYYIAASLNGANTFHNVNFSIDGIMNDNNIYNNITFTPGHTYTLASGTTQTVNNKLQIQGSCSNYIILQSSTQGSFATITKLTGSVLGFNIHIKDIHTTGGAIFNAFNSVNLGGNTGWLFSALVPLLPPNVIVGPSTVCAGATGVVYHTAPVAGAIAYQWIVPAGATIVSGQGDTTITVNFGTATAGNIVVNSFNGCNYSTTGSVLPIILPAQLTPSVTITANPSGSICTGTSVLFTATATNVGSNIVNYNFKVNGISVQNSTSNTFATLTLANADIISCTITISGGSCYTSTTATSNSITMVVNANGTPTVSIAANPSAPICSGTSVSFTATTTNTGSGVVTYNFKVNGVSVQNTNSNIFTSSALSNGNTVKCDISIAGGTCISATIASSNTITMVVNPILTPTVSIAPNPIGAICAGTSVTFTATAAKVGSGVVVYNFKVNGISVQNGASNIYTSTTLINADNVKCDITITGGNCLSANTATSTAIVMAVNPVVTPLVLLTSNASATVCAGTSIIFTANASNLGGGTVTYNFKVNTVTIQNTSSNTFTTSTLINGDIVSCTISITGGTCLAATTATSLNLTTNIVANITPSVSLAALITGPICAGTAVHFAASTTNVGGGTVTYNFKVNGISAQNTLSNVFNPTTLVNGDVVTCDVSITGGICLTTNITSSLPIPVSVLPSLPASINIVPLSVNICAGTSVTFSATPINGGNNPFYQWKINGVNVGANTTTFTTTTLNNNDIVSCTLTSNAVCVANVVSFSNNSPITVNASPNPSLIVTASDNNVCPNTPITFTAMPSNIGGPAVYQWQLNGNNVGTNSSTYFNSNLANGDDVKCILTTIRICTLMPVVLNSNVAMVVKPKPIISFNPASPTIVIGNSVVLNASVSVNAAIYLWTPSTGLSSTVVNNPIANPTQTTTYHLKVTSTDNCIADSTITVKVLTNTYIPNAFTPNADNVNDVFRIPPTAALRNLQYFIVFNRYGNKIFETTDITKGWDGTYQGTKSGMGAYTYMIKAFDNKGEVFLKGTVLLIR